MSGRHDWDSLVLALLYPVLYEKRPLDGVDRTMRAVVEERALGAAARDYLAAVRRALSSSEPLSARFGPLLVVPHSEDAIREYLAEIARRLERKTGSQSTCS